MADWKGSDTFFVIFGALQTIAAAYAFVYTVAILFAGAAYLGIGPGALPALLLILWGLITGIMLIYKRTVRASRLASIWYLPMGLFLCAFAFWNPRKLPWPTFTQVGCLAGGLTCVLIFIILVIPAFPVRSAHGRASNREESQ